MDHGRATVAARAARCVLLTAVVLAGCRPRDRAAPGACALELNPICIPGTNALWLGAPGGDVALTDANATWDASVDVANRRLDLMIRSSIRIERLLLDLPEAGSPVGQFAMGHAPARAGGAELHVERNGRGCPRDEAASFRVYHFDVGKDAFTQRAVVRSAAAAFEWRCPTVGVVCGCFSYTTESPSEALPALPAAPPCPAWHSDADRANVGWGVALDPRLPAADPDPEGGFRTLRVRPGQEVRVALNGLDSDARLCRYREDVALDCGPECRGSVARFSSRPSFDDIVRVGYRMGGERLGTLRFRVVPEVVIPPEMDALVRRVLPGHHLPTERELPPRFWRASREGGVGPPLPFARGDFNGDGVEDLVVLAVAGGRWKFAILHGGARGEFELAHESQGSIAPASLPDGVRVFRRDVTRSLSMAGRPVLHDCAWIGGGPLCFDRDRYRFADVGD